MIYYKKVLMPIEVAYGDYCFGDGRICPHFSNEGGHSDCDLGFDVDRDVSGRRKKPKECLELKEIY